MAATLPTLVDLTDMARLAGEAIVSVRTTGLEQRFKAAAELVTTADLASNRTLVRVLDQHWPGLHRVMEEGGGAPPASGPFLVADELDGTIPFASGFEGWAVMLTLFDDHGPLAAVAHFPDYGATLSGERGQGASFNGTPVRLSSSELTLSSVLVGTEINRMLTFQDWEAQRRLTAAVRGLRCNGCTSASLLELMTGRIQAYVNLRGGRIWDFAPAALLIREAGGAVSTPDGQPLAWDQIWMRFAAAANDTLLAAVLERTSEVAS